LTINTERTEIIYGKN